MIIMGKHAIFPGSFDPFTRGHESVVYSALKLFDKITIAIGVNSKKQYLFPLEDRIDFIRQVFQNEPEKVEIVSFTGLTVDYCRENKIDFIVRGLRNTRDFQFEYEIANMNRGIYNEIETIFIAALPEYSAINSTIVREIYRNGGDVSTFIPKGGKLRK